MVCTPRDSQLPVRPDIPETVRADHPGRRTRSRARGTRPTAVLAVLVALVILAAGCGSEDASSASESSATETQQTETDQETEQEDASTSEDGDADDASSSDGETRTVETLYGPVEVPVSPARVFALDEYAGAIMLSMGIEPIGAFAPYAARIPRAILDDAGVETTEAIFGEWNLELLAAADPDLIVLVDVQNEEAVQSFSQIAPAVVLPFVAPWRDVLAAIGEATGDMDRVARIQDGMEARIAEITETVDGSPVFSIVGTGPVFGTFTIGNDTSTAGILDEIGYARPSPQMEPSVVGASLPLSPENLVDHDGDILVGLGGDDSFYSIDELQALPLFASLQAVQNEQWVQALGEIWVNSDPFSMFWVIEDVARISAGEQPGTVDDRQDRWAAYLALADG
ncbi:MAG: ABC transporter substrate-binding protein [Actinomycetota bacterium]